MHGGVARKDLKGENLEALKAGIPNLTQHVSNVVEVFKRPVVVAINRFPDDTEAELELVREECDKFGVRVTLSEVWGKGGAGGIELAEEVVRLCDLPNKEELGFVYDMDTTIEEKVEAIAKRIYRADGVDFVGPAVRQLRQLKEHGFGDLPVCIAKTQYSFSDDPQKLGVPKDFRISVRNLKVSMGAGFIVALTGDVMTMPGLPAVPSAEKIDVDENGLILGLF
jgi:formate--tetrahydrofolate ligase